MANSVQISDMFDPDTSWQSPKTDLARHLSSYPSGFRSRERSFLLLLFHHFCKDISLETGQGAVTEASCHKTITPLTIIQTKDSYGNQRNFNLKIIIYAVHDQQSIGRCFRFLLSEVNQ